jgi:hypothetical protein
VCEGKSRCFEIGLVEKDLDRILDYIFAECWRTEFGKKRKCVSFLTKTRDVDLCFVWDVVLVFAAYIRVINSSSVEGQVICHYVKTGQICTKLSWHLWRDVGIFSLGHTNMAIELSSEVDGLLGLS